MLTSSKQVDAVQQSQADYSLLLSEYEEALRKIQNLDAKVLSLEEEIIRLKEQLKLMQHQRFGKKTEVNIGEPIVNPENKPFQTVSGHTRRKGIKSRGRLIDTSQLPRHQFYHDLPEEDKR